MFLVTARHVYTAVEQPLSSKLKAMPHIRFLENVLNRIRPGKMDGDWSYTMFWMGGFGGKTPKPSYLVASGPGSYFVEYICVCVCV